MSAAEPFVPPVTTFAPVAADEDFRIRDACAEDVPAIVQLLGEFAARDLLLPRTEEDVRSALAEFGVCVHAGIVVGVTSLHAYSAELGEVRSIAVREGCQRHGLGARLVAWALDRGTGIGVSRVFVLTYRARFFQRLGFMRIPRARLPEKVWGDCRRCPHAEYCDEVALERHLGRGPGAAPASAHGLV